MAKPEYPVWTRRQAEKWVKDNLRFPEGWTFTLSPVFIQGRAVGQWYVNPTPPGEESDSGFFAIQAHARPGTK